MFKEDNGWYLITKCEPGLNLAHLKISLNSYSGGDFDFRLNDVGIWAKPTFEFIKIKKDLLKLRFFCDGFYFGTNSQAKQKHGMPWNS